MVSVLSSTKSPRILIGRIGSNGPFNQIAEGLRDNGYRVTEWESSRIGVHSTDQDVQEQVKDIDLAFLVIRHKDTDDRGGPIRPLQRILVQAGLMQGKMQMNRVVLLVEESVRGLSADTGLSYIRFAADDPDSVLESVLAKINAVFPDNPTSESIATALPPPPVHRQTQTATPTVAATDATVGRVIADDGQSDALKVALRLVLLVVLAALFSVFLAFLLARGGDEGTEDASSETSDENADSTVDPGSTADTQAPVDTTAAPTTQAPAPTAPQSDGSANVDSPAAPAAGQSGSGQFLPATCQLNLRKGSLLDGGIRCDGSGQLELQGPDGPWHNDVVAIAIGEGVVGQVEFELRDDGTTDGPSVQDLPVGTTVLNEQDARFGVSTVILRFSGNSQHVHLFPDPSTGEESATLTFTLDR